MDGSENGLYGYIEGWYALSRELNLKKSERVQIPQADDAIISDAAELSRLDRSQSDSGTGLDSSMGYGVTFVRASDAGPHFTKEEWSRRLTPHIDKPLAGAETREMHIARLKRELAELEGAGAK